LIKALAFIHKKSQITDSEFKEYYETHHAPLAQSLLNFEYYERNYINSNLCPLYPSLGSISIFKYESEKSLAIVEEQMASNAGDTLRKDELNFMNVPQNYYVLTESKELTEEAFNKKIFCPLGKDKESSILDSIDGLKKISNNHVMEPLEITAIPEYGITENISLNTLENIMKDLPEIIFASSMR
tara:strand:+ start:453 stop:1007 length:555 start_codon:yes stop_codon:yes gene_type:complete